MNLRNGRIGIFDLSSGEATEDELTEEASKTFGLKDILQKHDPDAIVLGTGLLTGSLVPASGAGFVGTSRRLMAIMGHAGAELKLSGFDFIVLKGTAPGWGYLWVRDGIIEFVEMPAGRELNSWQRTDKIRSDQGDAKIQVLSAGLWCDSGSPASQLVVNYWGGEDEVGMGAEFGKRHLAAVAFRGMGELEVADPEGHFEKCVALMREQLSRLEANRGLQSYHPSAVRDDLTGLIHRHVGCYACPYPCRTYLKIDEDPSEMRLANKEPGYLHFDLPALDAAFEYGLDARGATEVLRLCGQAGAEPVAVLTAMAKMSPRPDPTSAKPLLSKVFDAPSSGKSRLATSFGSSNDFDSCVALGLCPRYWAKVGFDIGTISSCAEPALGFRLD